MTMPIFPFISLHTAAQILEIPADQLQKTSKNRLSVQVTLDSTKNHFSQLAATDAV